MIQHFDSTFAKLKDRVLTAVERENKASIILRFKEGESVAIGVSGECCSSSIFYEVEAPDLPATIEGAEQFVDDENTDTQESALLKIKRDFPSFAEGTECLSIWDVVLKTSKGLLRIRHINDSNGYYDGNVFLN